MTNAEKHALVLRIYDRLNQVPSPANQIEFLELFTSVLTDEQLEALKFAFNQPPTYHPMNSPIVELSKERDVKWRV